ncbi:hypothetical protein HWV62_1745 [Athelia sp. TMB]|nr:hypothetical protein HWV62_1745 [Athelia sp. TMB]
MTELTQLLSNLVLGDNEIRSNAEKAVNERFTQNSEVYVLALTQFPITADTEVSRCAPSRWLYSGVCSFSPPHPSKAPPSLPRAPPPPGPRLTLYDISSAPALASLKKLLLHSLLHEGQAFNMARSTEPGAREAAYRVFAGSSMLVMDLRTEAVVGVLKGELDDAESIEVRLAALRPTVAYLSSSDSHQLAHALSLLFPMLDILPTLPASRLPAFIGALTPLASTNPTLFQPHLCPLLGSLSALILPGADPDPAPIVARPNLSAGGFAFPPPAHLMHSNDDDDERVVDSEKEEVRKAALEFMISLSEAKAGMVKRVDGWAAAVVRGCLEGMGELADDDLEI